MELSRRNLLAGVGGGILLGGLPTAAHASTPRPQRGGEEGHTGSATGHRYYIAADGSDDNSGQSPDEAWASTERVNAEALEPGSQVLFRRGDRWLGNVVISDPGTEASPIVIGAYGSGSRPRIDATLPADDVLAATVLVHNAEHVHVRDLELTNDAEDQGMRNGVLVAVDDPQQPVYSGYLVHNVFVHDVRGQLDHHENDGKRSGGIGFALDGTPETVSRFHDITITDNTVDHVDQTGLWIDSNLRNAELPPGTDVVYRGYTWEQVKFTDIEVAYNSINDTARNGAIIRMADGGRFHHNVVSRTSDRVPSGNSVFTVSVYQFTVEWNEVHHNLSHDTADGCAFDPDFDSPGTTWRYNFSHDNHYGLLTTCTRPRDYKVEVYQNIDIGGKGRLINLNYGFTDVTFSNNAFWAKPVDEVEYPDTHPDYVNPDRETAGGYPQIIWETHEREGRNFEADQSYTYTGNVVFNEAPTATFYFNSDDENSNRYTERAISDNTIYGLWPGGQGGEPEVDGFTWAGEEPPHDWIRDTVGTEVYRFWSRSIRGLQNPHIGPRRRYQEGL
ncbi:MAG TPA: hypothetical protein VK095_01815 [Beutenbergiaceae bacterium]|nr:hypothetical protein [Beutenbergiaceae bacterium]